MHPRASRLLIVPVLAALLLAGLDYAAWRVATGRLLSAYLLWRSSIAAQGWQAASAPPQRTGWPAAALLRLDRTRLGQAAPSGFAWSADRVTFGVSLLHPRTLLVMPSGAQSIQGPGWPEQRFQAASLIARAPLSAPVRAARITARQLAVATPWGDAVAAGAAIDASWGNAAARLRADAGPVTLPAGHRWGLGRVVGASSLELVARGAWPPGPGPAAASAWRDAGGAIEVDHAALRWGTLDASGSGRLTLDADLQPLASLDLKVVDPGSALSMLADAGAISRGSATAGAAVLALLALPAQMAGQPGVLDLPVRIQAGTASLGQIPLAHLPKLRWGGAG